MSSPAVAQQGAPETAPVAEQKQPTREEMVFKIREFQEKQLHDGDRALRLAKARRGYRVETRVPALDKDGNETGFTKPKSLLQFLDPSVEPTDDELRAMVPLPGDRLNFDWKNEDKGTHGVVAVNHYGLISPGKQRGRIRPHMTKRNQTIKNRSMAIFKNLFAAEEQGAHALAIKENKSYVGVPEDVVAKLAAKATRIAMRELFRNKKAAARYLRRQQEATRKVNTGLLAGNQVHRYIRKGVQFGA